MASQTSCSWSCQLCFASYSSLFDLVSHVRAVHSDDNDLHFACQVDGCSRMFRKTNTWYKHLMQHHHEEYCNKYPSGWSSEATEDPCEESMHDDTYDSNIDVSPERGSPRNEPGPTPNKDETAGADEMAGKLLRIKEKHLISSSAIGEVMELFEGMIDDMTAKCLSAMWKFGEKYDMDTSSRFFQDMSAVLEDLISPLVSVRSVYKQQLFVSKNLSYVEPLWCEIGTHVGVSGTSATPINVPDGYYYVPFLKSLEALLNKKSVFSQVMCGSHQSDGQFLCDICDGTIWVNENDPLLQIICYYDELTLTNPLSSRCKKYKIGAIYYLLGNLDPSVRSRLEAINLLALFNSDLLRNYTLNDILRPFINDLKELDSLSGWPVKIGEIQYHLKGKLVAFVGDTPAVNMAGGFKEGVGMAMRKCRQCMATYDEIQTKFVESEFVLRSKEQHSKHCEYISRPGISESEKVHFSKVYGINRSTILLELSYFDVTQQLPQDLMHVLLEGVFPLHVEQFLSYITESNILTFSQINSRLLAFPYAYFETKPSPLKESDIHGSQTAAQMWELVNVLPFVIGKDMPPSDPHYECFMLLSYIASILFSPVISKDQIPLLSQLIKEYLEQFTTLYPHRPLTPKMHYLVHIPALIERYGPLVFLWSMRFESKHKQFKDAAKGASFKNILKTLSEHHQRMMAFDLHYNDDFASITVSTGPAQPTTSLTTMPYADVIYTDYPYLLNESVYRCQWATILGTKYQVKKCYMMIGTTDIQSGTVPEFGLLCDIIKYGSEPQILFVFKLMETIKFDSVFGAYEVAPLAGYRCLYRSSLHCYHPLNGIEHLSRSSIYIKPKYDLTVYCNY